MGRPLKEPFQPLDSLRVIESMTVSPFLRFTLTSSGWGILGFSQTFLMGMSIFSDLPMTTPPLAPMPPPNGAILPEIVSDV